MFEAASPITYKLNEIDIMIQDINNRSEIFSTFTSMWEQRIKLQFDYADKLRAIANINSSSLNNNILKKSNRPSWIFLSTLIGVINKESFSHQKFAQHLNEEIVKKVKQDLDTLQAQNKRNLSGSTSLLILIVKSLKRELQSEIETVQKNKHKFNKKNNELQKMKVEYINASLLQERDFQRKNKLFLKIKELQEEVIPTRKNYQAASHKYTEYLSISTIKFSEFFKKAEDIQLSSLRHMKSYLITSQHYKSGMSAVTVHETEQTQRQISQIQTQQTEITKHKFRDLQQQKDHFQKTCQNPSEYIERLFRKIEENSIEDIIKYGRDFDYKKELSRYFQNSQSFVSHEDLKVINGQTMRIIEIFKSVFQGLGYSQSILMEFKELIKTNPTLRKDFIFCLQKYRLDGKFKIYKDNFEHIVELLNIFLDTCSMELDTYNSKQFMVLSFTYYFINENQEKVDLQYYVKNHKIWHNVKWWECSLLQSIYEEHKVKKKKTQTSPSLWDIKGASIKKLDQNDENSTITNVCFNQLAYYVHNMQLFDMNNAQISMFANKYIKIFGFNSKMANDIIVMSSIKDQSPQK